jgi:hypothetical protein
MGVVVHPWHVAVLGLCCLVTVAVVLVVVFLTRGSRNR